MNEIKDFVVVNQMAWRKLSHAATWAVTQEGLSCRLMEDAKIWHVQGQDLD